ncbi:hypothetical protein DFH09DRAFT_847481, partial [Mycena vulgaris]
MDKFPDEIVFHISNLVCDELRSTARVLSTVSKRFHAIFDEFLYRTIDITGYKHMHQLVSNLENIPARCSRIRHLYICDTSDLGPPQRPLPALATDDMNSAIRILVLAAPTVESFAICLSPTIFNTPIISRLFLLAFPQFYELSILGPYPLPSSPQNFPRLRYLHVCGNAWDIGHFNTAAGLFSSGSLTYSFPSLTHLYISGLDRCLSVIEEL